MILHRDNYDAGSLRPGLCSILGIPRQPEETGVFRCGNIDTERGWLDISERAVGEMAAKIGWLPADQVAKLESYIEELEAERDSLAAAVDQSTLDTLHRSLREVEDAKSEVARQKERADEFHRKLESERRKTRRYRVELDELKKGSDSE